MTLYQQNYENPSELIGTVSWALAVFSKERHYCLRRNLCSNQSVFEKHKR